MKPIRTTLLTSALILALSHTAHAVELPHTFTTGTTAKAAEVNANFTALATAVQALQSELATLKGERDEALARIDVLEQQLDEASDFLALKEYVTLEPDPYILNEYTVRFTGVNVQIVNGQNWSNSINGLGNLIVGYNRPRTIGAEVCSNGSQTTADDCTGTWGLNHKSGSHNIVGGDQNAYSSSGGFVVGEINVINGLYASVSGGRENIASMSYSSISGGWRNIASGQHSSVTGGTNNTASGLYSSVTGGEQNIASGQHSSVTGGKNNTASYLADSVTGGIQNTASGSYSSVTGGKNNTASGMYSSVTGGGANTASNQYSSILGGQERSTTTSYQTIPAIQ